MTDKLLKLSIRRLHQMEVPQLIIRFIEDYEASKIKLNDDEFKQLFAQLKAKVDAFSALDKPINRNVDKSHLRELNKIRNGYIKGLMMYVQACRHYTSADEVLAYREINGLIKSYREMSRYNYEEESYAITELLNKLKQEPYRRYTETLTLGKMIADLTERQTRFNTAFQSISTKQAQQVRTSDLHKARKALYDEYQLLCEYIENRVKIKNTEPYKKVLRLINNGREFYIVLIRRRTGKRGKQKAKAMTMSEASVEKAVQADKEMNTSKRSSTETTPPIDSEDSTQLG